MILHTVNKSLFTDSCLDECLNLCADNASVLLIENAVYAATNTPKASETLRNHKHIQFYALEADILARGLKDQLNPDVKIVDDKGFVVLCTTHSTVQSWY